MGAAPVPDTPPLRVRPIPRSTPRRLRSVPELPTRPPEFVQGTLAVDFRHRDEDPYFGPQATSTPDLPDPQTWVSQLSQAIIETTAGLRPPAQLLRWLTPEVHAMVARRAGVAARRGAPHGRRAVVRSVHLCQPVDGVVEACAVVLDGGRVRAMALRMSGVDHRWLVTALQLG